MKNARLLLSSATPLVCFGVVYACYSMNNVGRSLAGVPESLHLKVNKMDSLRRTVEDMVEKIEEEYVIESRERRQLKSRLEQIRDLHNWIVAHHNTALAMEDRLSGSEAIRVEEMVDRHIAKLRRYAAKYQEPSPSQQLLATSSVWERRALLVSLVGGVIGAVLLYAMTR